MLLPKKACSLDRGLFSSPCLWVATALLSSWLFYGLAEGAAPEIDVRQFFFDPGQKTTLHISTDKPAGSTTPYIILDYLGKTVSTGNAGVKDGGWEMPVDLAAGYYDLNFPDVGQAFGLASIRQYQGTPDPFFCIDAALSWLAPERLRESYIQLLKRCGVAMARERLTWTAIHAAEGDTWNWDADRAFDRTRQLYRENGIPILELAHEAPPRLKPRPKMIWPDQMPAAAQDWTLIDKKWAPVWGGVEAWNEPDIDDVSADQYVPWVKTLSYAVRAAGDDTPVGGGVFAYLNRPYMDSAARNGLLDASNFISFHFYGQPAGLEAEVAEFRRWLEEFKRPEMPLWITEAGALWEGPPTARAATAAIQNSAMRIVGNAVEAKACGIARYFAFVYVDYSEGGKNNYGMLDLNGSPTRSMVSYAAAAQILKDKHYVGDLPVADAAIKRARVFSSGDDEAIVVFYTGAVTPGRTVALSVPAHQVMGIDGRVLKVDNAQMIPVPDGLGYASVSLDALKGSLNVDAPTIALSKAGTKSSLASVAPAPIILKPVLNDASLTDSKRGYSIAEGTKKLPLSILLANCDQKAHEVQITCADDTADGATLTTMSSVVQAMATSTLNAEVDLSNLRSNAAGMYQIRVTAQSPGIDRIEPVTMEFLPAHGLEEYLKQYAYRFVVPLGEAHRWNTNIASSGSMVFEHGPEAQWGFTAKFAGGDRWAFPKFVLPQEANLDRVEGILIRARCAHPATVRAMAWNHDAAMVMTPYSIIQPDGNWHVNYLPLDGFLKETGGMWGSKNASGLTTISIGMNSQTDKNQLEVSDLYLVGK